MVRILTLLLLFTCFGAVEAKAQTTAKDSIALPNVFTPNYDGVNDVFRPVVSFEQPYFFYHMIIYDRYGLLVFESDRLNLSWDGRTTAGEPCSQGTYFCTLRCKLNDEDIELKGFVYLSR